MATSTTFQGKPKPEGKSGHFYEPRRHSLQAKGIKTGNLSDQAVYEQYGVQNLEKPKPEPQDETMLTSQGLEDVQAGAMAEKKARPKPLTQKIRELEQKIAEGYKREQQHLAMERQRSIQQQLGKQAEDEDADEDEEPEEWAGGSVYGKILADILGEYSENDFAQLTDAELEDLAVKFQTRTKDNFFTPPNPFLDELKGRVQAQEEVKSQKAKLNAELEPVRMQVRKEVSDIKKRAKKGESMDFIERLTGW